VNRTIKRSLAQTLHKRRNSHHQPHLNTLALLICGIVSAQQLQFASIADHAPIRGQKNESLITRFRGWVKHDHTTLETLWLPYCNRAGQVFLPPELRQATGKLGSV
jgi:hypothetical protein